MPQRKMPQHQPQQQMPQCQMLQPQQTNSAQPEEPQKLQDPPEGRRRKRARGKRGGGTKGLSCVLQGLSALMEVGAAVGREQTGGGKGNKGKGKK